MNARDLLYDLAKIGATVEPAGDRLILRAGPTAIPATLVDRVREAKADLIATLALHSDQVVPNKPKHIGEQASPRFKGRALEECIVAWLNRHPGPSVPGRCAWCREAESPAAVVLPFGSEPGEHVWLHAECWAAWYHSRRAEAIAALGTTAPTS
jgi:hypothetical protein